MNPKIKGGIHLPTDIVVIAGIWTLVARWNPGVLIWPDDNGGFFFIAHISRILTISCVDEIPLFNIFCGDCVNAPRKIDRLKKNESEQTFAFLK